MHLFLFFSLWTIKILVTYVQNKAWEDSEGSWKLIYSRDTQDLNIYIDEFSVFLTLYTLRLGPEEWPAKKQMDAKLKSHSRAYSL